MNHEPTRTSARSLLTVREACAELRISRWMFYQLVHRKQLDTVKLGRRRLVSPAAVSRLIDLSERGGLQL